jgi:hypothetical protein
VCTVRSVVQLERRLFLIGLLKKRARRGAKGQGMVSTEQYSTVQYDIDGVQVPYLRSEAGTG